jgi:hypothetical protein
VAREITPLTTEQEEAATSEVAREGKGASGATRPTWQGTTSVPAAESRSLKLPFDARAVNPLQRPGVTKTP